jgi:hypothetical protein|tara:strand:+ start:277 stop:513 length:237 start_codon:yes stop_codon:yes gene_type:complete
MKIQSKPDPNHGGQIHIIPGFDFTGDLAADLSTLQPELLCWLFNELETSDSIQVGSYGYAGSDVQDHISEMPDEMFGR